MEPANVTPPTPDDAQLETLLRRRTTELPDDGFSQRVLAALPPAQTLAEPSRASWRAMIAGAIVGTVFAVAGVLFWPSVGSDLGDSIAVLGRSIILLTDPACLLAFGVAALSLYYVFRPRLQIL